MLLSTTAQEFDAHFNIGNFHDTLKLMNSLKYYFTFVLHGDPFTVKMLYHTHTTLHVYVHNYIYAYLYIILYIYLHRIFIHIHILEYYRILIKFQEWQES